MWGVWNCSGFVKLRPGTLLLDFPAFPDSYQCSTKPVRAGRKMWSNQFPSQVVKGGGWGASPHQSVPGKSCWPHPPPSYITVTQHKGSHIGSSLLHYRITRTSRTIHGLLTKDGCVTHMPADVTLREILSERDYCDAMSFVWRGNQYVLLCEQLKYCTYWGCKTVETDTVCHCYFIFTLFYPLLFFYPLFFSFWCQLYGHQYRAVNK